MLISKEKREAKTHYNSATKKKQRFFKKMSLKDLLDILSFKRGTGSVTEMLCIEKHIDVLNPTFIDGYGNRMFVIEKSPNADRKKLVNLFCCHTDTVHKTEGKQRVQYDKDQGIISLRPEEKDANECLGADDAIGMWLMIQMIKRKIPGIYLFHRGEEQFGKGSKYFRDRHAHFLRSFGVKYCISLDYEGTNTIVTHQFLSREDLYRGQRTRTCSDAFAVKLANYLGFSPIHLQRNGIFTDSASYYGIAVECVNVAVGYYEYHKPTEYVITADVMKALNGLIAYCKAEIQ